MKKIYRFIADQWFPLVILIIVMTSLVMPHHHKGNVDGGGIDIYEKGGVIVALILPEHSSEQLNVLADGLTKNQWRRGGRGDGVCYQFIALFDPKQGTYFVLGGPEKDTVLMVSQDPKEVLGWLHAVEDLKCNTISI